ncbi:MAG: carbohydrate binding domain-containing protein [Pseudobutyrivibrio sp.]|nr:carbohydrate binding domain-containing protein [Pseudobutyrivibrio sp.]
MMFNKSKFIALGVSAVVVGGGILGITAAKSNNVSDNMSGASNEVIEISSNDTLVTADNGSDKKENKQEKKDEKKAEKEDKKGTKSAKKNEKKVTKSNNKNKVTPTPTLPLQDSDETGGSEGGSQGETGGTPSEPGSDKEPDSSYELVWQDEFEGTSLNRADWNVELHEAGWVNNELQQYVDSTDNIYVKDGELVIKPVKTVDASGKATYTSGRVNTQNKHDFKYGYFEARLKVPEGMGYLPAFWMMPTDENLYGQWPRCGEIDIMEVMGQETDKAYGTVHFGNPHDQRQGTKRLSQGDFSNEYHVYAVDWQPGKISWYIDGVEYYTTSDWHSTTEGQGTVTYPAPFDQPFYMILNLAVGGSWVGYPDETTTFDDQQFTIDYVRVYQKTDGYLEEGITRPKKPAVVIRDADATGNYVLNGSFKETDPLDGSKNFEYLNGPGGEGKASIVSNTKFGNVNAVKIETINAGTEDYSIQFVQPNLPVEQGGIYKVSFDSYAEPKTAPQAYAMARAAEDVRTMIVDVSGPDHNYTRYLQDTVVNLTSEPQTYTYTFNMSNETDGNGRIEFNLGNQGSTDTVYITNIRYEKVGTFELDTTKKALADGNYIYNGAFQEGSDRMEYWTVVDPGKKSSYKVTSLEDGRRLEVASIGCSTAGDVKLVQGDIPVVNDKCYAFSFDAKMNAGQSISVNLLGENKTYAATKTGINSFTDKIIAGDNKSIEFYLGLNGTVSVDNVRLVEDAMIKNGSFDAGLAGYEVYAYTPGNVSYTVDSISENNAFDITIKNTGAEDWHIQLKQNNVELRKDQWYRLSFDAKSSMNRKIMYALQRDGSADNNWTPYCQDKVDVNNQYTHVSKEFQMNYDTDSKTILSISMGAVNGIIIPDQHRVCLDNFVLEEIEAPAVTEEDCAIVEGNLVKNADFSQDFYSTWSANIGDRANYTIDNGTITFDIADVGSNDWDVQLKQEGLVLQKGAKYKVSYDIESTSSRIVKSQVMSATNVWYFGDDTNLTANEPKHVEYVVEMSVRDDNANISFSMGKIYDYNNEVYIDTPTGKVKISNIVMTQLTAGVSEQPEEIPEEQPEEIPEETPLEPVWVSLLSDADMFSSDAGWINGIYESATATVDFADKVATYNIESVGDADWHVQLKKTGFTYNAGDKYRLKLTLESDVDRSVKVQIMHGDGGWITGDKYPLTANMPKEVCIEYTMKESENFEDGNFSISMGKMIDYDANGNPIESGEETPAGTIKISSIFFEKLQ